MFRVGVLLFALIGVVIALRDEKKRTASIFLLLLVLYFVGATIFVAAYGAGARLRYPVDALLFLFAAAGMYLVFNRFFARYEIR